jgi:prolyl oligopeptidase
MSFLLSSAGVWAQFDYPATKTVDNSDTHWGQTIQDPYRWIEDLKDPEVREWFYAQADYTNAQMAKIPGMGVLAEELRALFDQSADVLITPLSMAGGRYFFKKRFPGEQVFKLYYREGAVGEDVLLFDPQKYEEGKTMDYEATVSADGSRVLLNLSEQGAELGDIRVIEVASGRFLPDVIPHSKGVSFLPGSSTSFTYLQAKSYDITDPELVLNRPCKVHVLGTSVEEDKTLASAEKHPELGFQPYEIPVVFGDYDSPWLFMSLSTVNSNMKLFYAPKAELSSEKIPWRPLTTIEDEIHDFVAHGNDVYFLTAKGTPRFKIIKTSLKQPDLSKAETVFEPEAGWQVSGNIRKSKNFLTINVSKNELMTKSVLYEFRTGRLTVPDIALSGNITLRPLSVLADEFDVSHKGWTTPANNFHYVASTGRFSEGPFHMNLKLSRRLENLVYEELEVPSYDGVLVPLSVIYDRTKLNKDGNAIVYMTGYGAYGMSYKPFFPMHVMPLLERGVVYAVAHVRGGGEKGNDWYLEGKKATKPNTWKDLNACAEYLIAEGYTTPDKLTLSGASAGGILVGRAVTSRPDLYRVAIPQVGVMNPLRMEFSPNGPVNVPEFGTVTIEEEFHALMEMDAYHQTVPGVKYPAQLITVGFNDPRVIASNPAKYAAKMQSVNSSAHPIFLDVDFKAGHFSGGTLDERHLQDAKEFAFLLWQCGHPDFQPEK